MTYLKTIQWTKWYSTVLLCLALWGWKVTRGNMWDVMKLFPVGLHQTEKMRPSVGLNMACLSVFHNWTFRQQRVDTQYKNRREGTSSTTVSNFGHHFRSWSTVSAGLGLGVLSNICSVSIYWKEMLDWLVSRLDWVQKQRGDNQNSSSRPKCMYPPPRNLAYFGSGWHVKKFELWGFICISDFHVLLNFLPSPKYWQQQPGAESWCPAELSRHWGEIRMEHGCYEDFNRGRSLFGILRFGTDSSSDQHWQLVRDWREEAPGTLQELFKQKKRPRLHLHLQQQPSTSHVAKGEKCGEEERRNAVSV